MSRRKLSVSKFGAAFSQNVLQWLHHHEEALYPALVMCDNGCRCYLYGDVLYEIGMGSQPEMPVHLRLVYMRNLGQESPIKHLKRFCSRLPGFSEEKHGYSWEGCLITFKSVSNFMNYYNRLKDPSAQKRSPWDMCDQWGFNTHACVFSLIPEEGDDIHSFWMDSQESPYRAACSKTLELRPNFDPWVSLRCMQWVRRCALRWLQLRPDWTAGESLLEILQLNLETKLDTEECLPHVPNSWTPNRFI